MIIDPWGVVLAQASDGEGVAVADLDFARLAEIRERLPAAHRRDDVYGAAKARRGMNWPAAACHRGESASYDLVEADDLLAPVFDGLVTREHRDHVTTWWCEVLGGPADYTRDLGGYEHMLARHRALGITPEQRLRCVALLSRPRTRRIRRRTRSSGPRLMAYAEWGTRLAMHNSQPGADVAPHAPVPRWGWGVAPPY